MAFLRAHPDLVRELRKLYDVLDPAQYVIKLTPHYRYQFQKALGAHRFDSANLVELEPTDVQVIEYMLYQGPCDVRCDDLERAIAQVCLRTRPNSASAVSLSTSQKLQLNDSIAAHREVIRAKKQKIAQLHQLVQELTFNRKVEDAAQRQQEGIQDVQVFDAGEDSAAPAPDA